MINPYLIVGSAKKEVVFTKALSYWLNPLESHGMGRITSDFFLMTLKRCIDRANQKSDYFPLPQVDFVQTELHLDRKNRVDLCLITAAARIFIEVKLGAGEGKDQMERYLETAPFFTARVARSILAFVTPDGRFPESVSLENRKNVVCVGFADLKLWISEILANTISLTSDQKIGLIQFQDWIDYATTVFEGRCVAYEQGEVLRFWTEVREKLAERLAAAPNLIHWRVGSSVGNTRMEEGAIHLDHPYSRLGYFCPDGTSKLPMVIFESIEGTNAAAGACFGIRTPFKYLRRRAPRESQDLEATLVAKTAEQRFSQDRWFFAYRYFTSQGWPSFQPGDAFTRAVLGNAQGRHFIIDDMAARLFELLNDNAALLEKIEFEPS